MGGSVRSGRSRWRFRPACRRTTTSPFEVTATSVLAGGPRGDILVILEVEEDPRFIRDGEDIIHILPLSFSQAALGVEVEIPTVLGSEDVTIPAGVQSGEVIVLRGKGLPRLGGGGRGDQQVRVQLWTPQELTEEQEELFRKLAEVEGAPPGEGDRGRGGFWSRVKEAFTA